MRVVHPRKIDKAVPPEDTVRRIRGILDRLDLQVTESLWCREPGLFSSIHLSLSNLPVFANGKGVDDAYALASAYAEFMERLQNLLFLRIPYAGRQDVRPLQFADGRHVPYSEFKDIHPNVWASFFPPEEMEKVESLFHRRPSLYCIPYYHGKTDAVAYLPCDLLIKCTGSNGMCAGNTPEEALIQGICEIFERNVLKQLYRHDKIPLPVVPRAFYETACFYPTVRALEERGHEVQVMDCSLGGAFPVAGVLVRKDGKTRFSLGASPDFTMAVERCLTEFFQGWTFETLNQAMACSNSSETENIPMLPPRNERKRPTASEYGWIL